ncbi:hypothetical protein F0U61_24405 [Archangium violaceum]|uniref:hypothetical protein n=1 Tax=Archangium violaceum TaxID=83451 RepID=UPI002B29C2D5|nr:hypothetical protein F0U61_24405 [Archangium violaceum]
MWPLVILTVLQAGCLLEAELAEVTGECGPRDLTPECCLKQHPGQWERCTGSSEMVELTERSTSLGMKTLATGMAVATTVAMKPQINSAERRGVELAADLLTKIEKAITKCVRQADQYVNDYHFNGKSPDREICEQIKVGEKTTWAAYLGLFKHEQAWPCLREALNKLIPPDRYRLYPRFQFNEKKGQWEYMDENTVSQIVSAQGWKGLTGTIEPDIILLDKHGVIVRVYDLKFPCPETNSAYWSRYTKGRWMDQSQGDLYFHALQVKPILVSPRQGIIRED